MNRIPRLARLFVILGGVATSGALGCGGAESKAPPIDTPTTPTPSVVTTVSVDGPTVVYLGSTGALTATVKDQYGATLTGRTITWASSAPAVMEVSSLGVVRPLAVGPAQVSATVGAVTGSLTVLGAEIIVNEVLITSIPTKLFVGQAIILNAVGLDSSKHVVPGRVPVWSSSNPSVADIAPSGLLVARSPGTTTVSATVSGKTTSFVLPVVLVPVSSVAFVPFDTTIAMGDERQLVAFPRDSAGNALTGRKVTWSRSKVDQITIDTTGLIHAWNTGFVVVTASSEGKSVSQRIAVRPDTGVWIVARGVPGHRIWYFNDPQTPPLWDYTFSYVQSDSITWSVRHPAPGYNRIRAVLDDGSAPTPLVRGVGGARNVYSQPATLVTLPVTFKPLIATVTPPATAYGGQPIPITWTWTDSLGFLDIPFEHSLPPYLVQGTVYYGTAPFADAAGAQVAATTITRTVGPFGTFVFTANIPSQPTGATVFYQVYSTGVIGGVVWPMQARGESLLRITVR